jgi:molybdenum cofactor guanylyltransferase
MLKALMMMPRQSGANLGMINVDAVILAAGRSSRMGVASKALLPLNDLPLLDHVIKRLAPQVDSLIVSGDQILLDNLDYPVIEDVTAKFSGPLAGLYSALVSSHLSDAEYLMVVPCDGPLAPETLVAALYRVIRTADADVACVRYDGVVQGTFSLWHKRQVDRIKNALLVEKYGGFKPLMRALDTVYLDWPEQSVNPFFNINTPDDLKKAEKLLYV